jgi:hypothetical protein
VNANGCSASQLDADGDGVSDAADLCPGTPAGEPVNANGCSASQLDADGDGVSDAADQCPGTPAGEPVNANGCSASQLDADGDGVSDAADQCPGTPAGEPVNANGCSASQLDSDGDGVSDAADQCPGTPAGEPVNANGCSASQLDSDGDGVPDSEDICPGGDDTVDSDNDGVPDACDETQCPIGTSWNGETCEPIVCPFGLVLEGNVCVAPETAPGGGGGATGIIPVTGVCDPFSVEEVFADDNLGILVLLNNLCNYNTTMGIVSAEIPAGIDYLSGLEITLMLGNSVVTQMPPRTSMQLFFEIPEEMATPDELAKHEFAVMYWDPFAKNGGGEWVELETTVVNGQVVVLITPGTPVVFPASFVLVDKTAIEGASVPSTFAWANDLYLVATQWFNSLVW